MRGLDPAGGLAQIRVRDDVVALEHAAGLVARDLHGHAFRDAAADHFPDRRAAKVMKQLPQDARGLTGFRPGGAKLSNRPTVPGKDPRHKRLRPLERGEHGLELVGQIEEAPLAAFGRAHVQARGPRDPTSGPTLRTCASRWRTRT
jgi:hypothetical protein